MLSPSRRVRLAAAAAAKTQVWHCILDSWTKAVDCSENRKACEARQAAHIRVQRAHATGVHTMARAIAHSSVLIQLGTERIGLNHILHKIGLQDSDWCGCVGVSDSETDTVRVLATGGSPQADVAPNRQQGSGSGRF